LAHGCAQGADAAIHLPPGRVGRQSVEVDHGILKTRLRWQWSACDRDYLGDPAVGKRLPQNRLAYQPGCANK
jgi:hypothetical protein